MKNLSILLMILVMNLFISKGTHAQFHAEQIRGRYQTMERNFNVYGDSSHSFHGAQIASQGNFINRMDGYFGIQGVNIFNPNDISNAIDKDQLVRNQQMLRLTREVEQNINKLNNEGRIHTGLILNSNGELATYDKETIRKAASNLERLSKEAKHLEFYIGSEFKKLYRNAMIPSYIEKPEMVLNARNLDQVAHYYINGAGQFKGVSGIKEKVLKESTMLYGVADTIARQEERMEEEITNSYILGGVGLAASIVTFGAALAPVAQLASGTALVSGSASIGQSIRTHIILESKGMEGLVSANEKNAALGLYAFQSLASAVSIGADIYQLNQQTKNLSQLKPTEKLYIDTQYLRSALSLTELSGLNKEIFGENGSSVLQSALMASGVIFKIARTDKAIQAKSAGSPLNKMVQHPDPWIRKLADSQFQSHPFLRASSIIDGMSALASVNESMELWFNENRFGRQLVSRVLHLGAVLDHANFENERLKKKDIIDLARKKAVETQMDEDYPPLKIENSLVFFGDSTLEERKRDEIANKTIQTLIAHRNSLPDLNNKKGIPLFKDQPIQNIYLVGGRDPKQVFLAYETIKKHPEAGLDAETNFKLVSIQKVIIHFKLIGGDQVIDTITFPDKDRTNTRFKNDPESGWTINLKP